MGTVLGCLDAPYENVEASNTKCDLVENAEPSAPLAEVGRAVYRESEDMAAEMLETMNLYNPDGESDEFEPPPRPVKAPKEEGNVLVSSEFTFGGADEEAQDALVQALQDEESGKAVKKALAESVAASAGINAADVVITEVTESVEGSLEFDFGDASESFAAAFENPDTKKEIERTLQTAVASGLLFVDPSDVTILGVSSARALHARRLSGTSVDYAIKVPLGKGAEVAAEVTEIDTSIVAASAAQGLKEVAAENPEFKALATVEVVLAEPEPPRVELVVEYEVEVSADEGGNVADQLSAMDASKLSDEVSTNVKAADDSLANIAVAEVEVGEVVKPPPPPPPPREDPIDETETESTAVRGALALSAFMILETLRAH
jgi:hypothetical protein